MSAIEQLTREFTRLPGIGQKTALRLVYHLMKGSPDDARRLGRAIREVADRVRPCERCGNFSEERLCEICTNPRRDPSVICVVEEAYEVGAIERTGEYRGLYHVLGGRLSPLDGVGPEELGVDTLMARVRGEAGSEDGAGTGSDGEDETPAVEEVILATNASVEGEATAVFVEKLVRAEGVRVTRLARGIPVGSDLEYVDGTTLAEALAGRREM